MLNRISRTMKAEEKIVFFQHLNALKSLFDFFVMLTPTEKKRLRSKGIVHFNYVKNVYTGIKANPSILPPVFNIDEYAKDVELISDLQEMFDQMKALYESFESTMIQLGSEAMRQSDEAYSFLKQAARKNSDPELDLSVRRIAEQLKQEIKESKSAPR